MGGKRTPLAHKFIWSGGLDEGEAASVSAAEIGKRYGKRYRRWVVISSDMFEKKFVTGEVLQ